jgi:hypothetical protein
MKTENKHSHSVNIGQCGEDWQTREKSECKKSCAYLMARKKG